MVIVAIESVAFPGNYVRLDGRGVNSPLEAGGGIVNTQTYIDAYDKYTLVENSDGTVSFKSTAFNNVFLRLDGSAVTPGDAMDGGGGIVNAQYTAGSYEKFKIIEKDISGAGYQGIVGIESAACPGRYLRLGYGMKVTAQGVFGGHEVFKLLVVGTDRAARQPATGDGRDATGV